MSDAVSEAASRLERAVERLAAALAANPAGASGVSAESVAALSTRLDDTLERLRGALAELEGAEPGDEPAEQATALPPDNQKGS
ncbi:hypothetical protein [Teichococcus vastitatis]|uniref:Uncharacterized protein n=1 Tax=Teichococcus vastitatis TaxID=2307076 RepID=A0ABS9W637_9PROT|nr:hypothetical protein [Pseudoroseomonas vastitatis]MCI0754044.1 hypothetical protein [Pseudoroseomonas vastitatis]